MNVSGTTLAAALPLLRFGELFSMPPQPDPISAGLKKLFERVAEEPIPDEFLSMLDRIDTERATRDASTAGAARPGGSAQ